MDKPTLLSLPPEVLRERVLAVLRRHWVAPRILDLPDRVPLEKVEDLSRGEIVYFDTPSGGAVRTCASPPSSPGGTSTS